MLSNTNEFNPFFFYILLESGLPCKGLRVLLLIVIVAFDITGYAIKSISNECHKRGNTRLTKS